MITYHKTKNDKYLKLLYACLMCPLCKFCKFCISVMLLFITSFEHPVKPFRKVFNS